MQQEVKPKSLILYAKNEINSVPLKRLSDKEIDLFFYLCFCLNEKEAEKIILSFSEIKKILDFKPNDIKRLSQLILRTHKKLLEINFTIEENKKIISFPTFYEFGIDEKNKDVYIQVHPRFQHVLNYFKKGNFTKINLLEIVSLKSNYAKKIYPILKQFESTGEVYLRELKDWREMLCIPESYDYKEINRIIWKPIIKELLKYFFNLKIITKTNGRKITHIGFTFKPLIKEEIKNIIHNEKKIKKQISIYDLEKETKIKNKTISQEQVKKMLNEIDS